MLEAHDVEKLLSELCVDLGVCLPPAERERLKGSPPDDLDEFVDAILVAEGLDPLTCWFRADVRARAERSFLEARLHAAQRELLELSDPDAEMWLMEEIIALQSQLVMKLPHRRL